MGTYIYLGWKDKDGNELDLEEYCKLVNTSVQVFKDFYVRDTGLQLMRKTEAAINHYLMTPPSQ